MSHTEFAVCLNSRQLYQREEALRMGGGGSKREEWALENGAGFVELIAPELVPGFHTNPANVEVCRKGRYETIVVPLLDICAAYHVSIFFILHINSYC